MVLASAPIEAVFTPKVTRVNRVEIGFRGASEAGRTATARGVVAESARADAEAGMRRSLRLQEVTNAYAGERAQQRRRRAAVEHRELLAARPQTPRFDRDAGERGELDVVSAQDVAAEERDACADQPDVLSLARERADAEPYGGA